MASLVIPVPMVVRRTVVLAAEYRLVVIRMTAVRLTVLRIRAVLIRVQNQNQSRTQAQTQTQTQTQTMIQIEVGKFRLTTRSYCGSYEPFLCE